MPMSRHPAVRKLSDAHRIFAYEYVIDGDAARAAAVAGYAPGSASRLLNAPRVAVAIGVLRREAVERAIRRAVKTKEQVLEELTEMAFEPGVDVKGGDKIKALTLIGQELGIFKEEAASKAVKVVLTINGQKAGQDG